MIDDELLGQLDASQLAYLDWQARWLKTARDNQIPPEDGWTECGFMAGRGFGKALALTTPVPTPFGWATMGDLRDGDVVFDERGHPCRVLKAHEPYEPTDLYRVRFSDGTSLTADGSHLWVTWDALDRKRLNRASVADFPADWAAGEQRIRTTQQIADTLTRGRDRNHCVPLVPALRLQDIALPVDPWLLGYWLGNGAARDATLSCHDADAPLVFDRARALGYGVSPRTLPREGYVLGLTGTLKALGLVRNKHVPLLYLRAGVAQRKLLLAGLLDSDGHCHAKSGHVEFCSTDEPLARGVLELARSLGQKPVLSTGRAMLRGVDHGAKYRVTWRPTFNPFSLPRKAEAYREPGAQRLRNTHRMIVAVEPVAPETVRCITVSSPNAMYLAGEGMIPTHNTRVGAEWLGRVAYEDCNALPRCVVAPTQADVRFTCFEGESGLLSVIPHEVVKDYNRTDLLLTLANGATIRGFSAEKADRLRGPQHADAWCDEIAAWGKDGTDTWDMLQFGMRLGPSPRTVWTSTPKPVPIVRQLTAKRAGRIIITGSTYDNKRNLPKSFFDNIAAYEGTKLGRQELDGELLDPEEAGIIKRSWFNLWPKDKPLPRLDFIVLSLDTAYTEATRDKKTGDADPTACTVWGVFYIKRIAHMILLDAWDEHLGLPDLIRRTKREMNTAYGDDEDAALIKPMFGTNKPLTSGRKPDVLLIEDKGSGISLRQMLAEANLEAYAYNPGRADKLARLHVVSPIFAQRRVWVPESDRKPGQPRTWAEPMIAQLCAFTGEGSIKHDDFVDSCSQAFRLCMDKGFVKLVKPPKEQPRVEEPLVNPYAA